MNDPVKLMAALPKWGVIALWNLQYSPFRVTYCGLPLRPLLQLRADLQDAAK